MRSDAGLRPTLFGLKAVAFYALLLVAFFASPYTNLFFLLLAFLTVVLALDVFWTAGNLRGASARIAEIGPLPAGAVHEVPVEIDAGRRPRLCVKLEMRIGTSSHTLVSADILRGRQTCTARLPALPRGIHEVRGTWLTSTYPLGVLRALRRADAPRRLVVYPAPVELDGLEHGAAVRADTGAASWQLRSADGQVAGLRPYRDGDPIKLLHWRACARSTRELVVRELEPAAERSIEVRLDRRTDAALLERALGAVARLALIARDSDRALTLTTQGLQDEFGAGRRNLDALWEFLATATPLPPGAPAPAAARGRGAVELPAALERSQRLRARAQEATR